MAKKAVERKYSIEVFLRKSDRPAAIKQMMRELFPHRAETLDEWARIDKSVNEREVK